MTRDQPVPVYFRSGAWQGAWIRPWVRGWGLGACVNGPISGARALSVYGAPSVNLLFSTNTVTISLIYLVISNNQITGRGASWLYQITRLLTMAHFGNTK